MEGEATIGKNDYTKNERTTRKRTKSTKSTVFLQS